MTTQLKIVEASIDHLEPIASRMRKADRLEVMASSGSTPHRALMFSLEKSSLAWTAIINGEPEVMFGVGDLNVLTKTGAPWLLGTDAIEQHVRLFLRSSLHWREKLFNRYEVMRNFVDDRNEVSKRWLSWLGFTLHEPMSIGVNGEMFRLFEMRR